MTIAAAFYARRENGHALLMHAEIRAGSAGPILSGDARLDSHAAMIEIALDDAGEDDEIA